MSEILMLVCDAYDDCRSRLQTRDMVLAQSVDIMQAYPMDYTKKGEHFDSALLLLNVLNAVSATSVLLGLSRNL